MRAMMSKGFLVGLILATLIGGPGKAAAGAIHPYRCSACTTEQAKDIAIASYQSTAYVYDLVFGQLWKFVVERDWEHGGTPLVWEFTPEPGYVTTMEKWFEFYQATGGSAKAYVEIGAAQLGLAPGTTGYDIAVSSAARRDVATAIARDLNTIAGYDVGIAVSSFVTALQRAFNIIFRSDDPVVEVRVYFEDGSYADFILTDDDTNGEPDYEAGSAFDAHGNQVLERNSASGAGRYRMNGNPTDVAGWIDHARSLGVEVTGPQGNVINCTWDGRTLTCSIQP